LTSTTTKLSVGGMLLIRDRARLSSCGSWLKSGCGQKLRPHWRSPMRMRAKL
jgi:hypothetical protein